MDRAVRLMAGKPGAGMTLVSAFEEKKHFDGEPPHVYRYLCPCCMRGVDAAAFGVNAKVEPHFKHKKNDDLAKHCENYMSGNGSPENDNREPIIPLFLRRSDKSPERFVVEVGFWRFGETVRSALLGSDSFMVVDGKQYPLWRFAKPGFKIPLRKLRLAVSDVIQFLGTSSKTRTGVVENAQQAFIFNDDFGDDGGRRVRFRDSVKSEREYYIVATADVSKRLNRAFDSAKHVGTVQGDGETFDVTKVCIGADSGNRERAERLLASFGYCLTDYDRTAKLIWPPAVDVYGIDTPIFQNSPVVYKPLFQANDRYGQNQDRDRVSFHPVGERYRLKMPDIGLIENAGRGLRTDCEAGCLFIKPGKMQSWLCLALDDSIVESMELSDLDECSVTLDIRNVKGKGSYIEIEGKYPVCAEVFSRQRHMERVSVELNSERVVIPVDRRQIMRIVSSKGAFPREWQLLLLDSAAAHTADVGRLPEFDGSLLDRGLVAELSLGYRIAGSRSGEMDRSGLFGQRSVQRAKERMKK